MVVGKVHRHFFFLLNNWINATHCLSFVHGQACQPCVLDLEIRGRELQEFIVVAATDGFPFQVYFFQRGLHYFCHPHCIFFFFFVNHTGLYHNYVHTLVSSLASVKEVADDK